MRGVKNCLIVGILTLSPIMSCTKQKHYPSESSTGKNVFGCYVNQKEFIPCARLFQWHLKTSGQNLTSPTNLTIKIEAQNICDNSYTYARRVNIYFSKVPVQEKITYKFGRFQEGQISCVYSEDLNYYYSDSILSGSITIRRFDPMTNILSADFDAVLKHRDSLKTVTITKGTFDVKLDQ